MKNTASLITKLTLGLAIAGAITACDQKAADKPATTATTTTSTVTAKEAIVYVNSDSLLNKYDYFKDMSKRLMDKGKVAQNQVEAKGQAFQREVTDYQKSANTLSADQRASTEQRLQREEQDFQSYKQNATAEFQSEQSAENAKLYDKVADYVKKYAKEKGYKLVLTYSKANPTVLYGDPALDVTLDVAKGLNQEYTTEKK